MKKRKVLAMMMLAVSLCTTSITGCSGTDTESATLDGDLTKKTVITINGTKVTMDTMMYYIMEQEAEYSYYDTYYMATYGTSYWDMELDDNVTVREKLKEYVFEVAQLYEIFYQEAEAKGYELTEDDISEAEENAESIWESMSDKQKEATDLTQDSLTEIYKKISLATKYYDDVDAGLEIDEDAATESVNKDDYKEYSIEMMTLDKTTEDDDGYTVDVPKKTLKKALKRMETYQKKAEKKNSLEDVLPKKEKYIEVQSMVFMEGDGQLNDTLQTAAMKLENDAYTDIIEVDAGYVIIRMVDNECTDSYDEAVETAIEDAQTEAFDNAYEEIKKSYDVEVNDELWDQVTIGNLTIDDEDEESVEVTDDTSEE